MQTTNAPKKSLLRIKLDDKPPMKQTLILAFQAIFACFSGIVAVPLVVAGALGLKISDTSFLVSCALFASGLTTLIQAKGIGPIGSKLPFIMGTSFAFVSPAIAIGSTYNGNMTLGIATICTATMVGALLEVILSFFINHVKKIFPPLVTGTVVTMIGITIIPVGIDWLAGGSGNPNYGDPKFLLLGAIVLIIIIITNQSKNTFISSCSIFIGILCGYLLAIPFNLLDTTPISAASWISIPRPLKFGIKFSVPAIISFLAVYLATTVETVGDTLAIGEACEIEVSNNQLSGGVLCDGLGSILAGFFNSTANTSFSQCTGLINVTGVASRFVIIIAGIILSIMGLIPKFASLISIMPSPVLGAAGIVMFGSIACSGIKILGKVDMTRRNIFVIGISFALGVGVIVRPEALSMLPESLQIIFGSGVTTATIFAVILNLILPSDKSQKPVIKAKSGMSLNK